MTSLGLFGAFLVMVTWFVWWVRGNMRRRSWEMWLAQEQYKAHLQVVDWLNRDRHALPVSSAAIHETTTSDHSETRIMTSTKGVDPRSLHRLLLEQLQSWASAGLLQNFSKEFVWNDSDTGWKEFKRGAIRVEARLWFDYKNPATHGPLRLGVLDFANDLARQTGLSVIHAIIQNPNELHREEGGQLVIALGEPKTG
jgi:hypothetical protein